MMQRYDAPQVEADLAHIRQNILFRLRAAGIDQHGRLAADEQMHKAHVIGIERAF
jgi:hypothetical protein